MVKTIQSPILQAALSGLLLSAAFPKVGFSWLAWIALVPLLLVLRRQRSGSAFRIGMIAGLAHYLTLLYWVVFTMRTYGFLPWWQCVGLLLLLSAYLAIYPGLFALALTRFGKSPVAMVLLAPIFWVGLEYARSFLLTGFPWGVVGYSQVNRLLIIQLADMFGVYGVSFLVVSANAVLSALIMAYTRRPWQGHQVTRAWAWQSATFFIVLICLSLVYGNKRIGEMDRALAGTPSNRIAVIQGNIDQARKWDPAFPDLVVWPETATPFYFEASPKLTRLVTDAVRQTGVHLLVGSPSVDEVPAVRRLFNSAYMVAPDGRSTGRYDKVHLVPFGEYVPLKRILSFVGQDGGPGGRLLVR
jgi:apolipoprotein N-acyltransferase